MIYFKQLDTLRFIAFLFVFTSHLFIGFDFRTITDNLYSYHFYSSILCNGQAGVQLFFVLSGFLITFLLCQERQKFGEINFQNFYMRRMLRIWPLYYLVLILGIFVLPHLANSFEFDGVVWKNLVFLNNFELLKKGQEINTGVAWSVAIEEQFYVIWPVLFMFFRNNKHLIASSIVIYLFSCIYTFLSPTTAYFHTFGNLNYLMIGCIGGILYADQKKLNYLSKFKSRSFFTINLCVILLLNNLKFLPVFVILPFNYLFLILYLVLNNSTTKGKNILMSLGKYTYGMYLYHAVFLIGVKIILLKLDLNYENSLPTLIVCGIIALVLTVTCAILSYNFFELPFLKLKGKFNTKSV